MLFLKIVSIVMWVLFVIHWSLLCIVAGERYREKKYEPALQNSKLVAAASIYCIVAFISGLYLLIYYFAIL